jgi:hypothetical protein
LAGGALLTFAWGGFVLLYLTDAATPLNLVGQVTLVFGSLALLAVAWRRVRREADQSGRAEQGAVARRHRPHRGPQAPGGRSELTYPLGERLVILVGIPALAVLIGLLLPPLARWLLGLSVGLPMRLVFVVLGSTDRPWEVAVNLVIWLLIGLGVARSAVTEAAKVTLTDAELRVRRGGRTLTIARADVAAVFLDRNEFVVLDGESRQVVRDKHQAPDAILADGFRAHGYPWLDADPHAARFRQWVPDTAALPPSANALLAVRASLLKTKSGRQVSELRDALEALGVVVRDEGAQQYWRPLVTRCRGSAL